MKRVNTNNYKSYDNVISGVTSTAGDGMIYYFIAQKYTPQDPLVGNVVYSFKTEGISR